MQSSDQNLKINKKQQLNKSANHHHDYFVKKTDRACELLQSMRFKPLIHYKIRKLP